MHLARPAGSFLPLFSSTPTTWSLTSALETRERPPPPSPDPGRRRGTSGCRMAGKERRAPTSEVASVRGTPRSSPLEITLLQAYKKS